MKDGFFKFPSTPHLTILPGVKVRDDKVLTEAERNDFLQHNLVVEEKIDGANLGISFDSKASILIQNRGSYLDLPASGQWKTLEQWLIPKIDLIFEIMADRYILFGEWCYAQHAVFYNRLPDWFLGFDLYDKKTGKFLSVERRNKAFIKMGIAKVPLLANGHFSFSDLEQLLSHSRISDQSAEGLYLRIDQGDWLLQRAKLVRSSFIQSIEKHWSRSAIKPNQLNPNIWENSPCALQE